MEIAAENINGWYNVGKGVHGRVLNPDDGKTLVKRFRNSATEALKEAALWAVVQPHSETTLHITNTERGPEMLLRMPRGMFDVEHMCQRARVEWPNALVILQSVARDMLRLHRLGLCHMDIKPANIVVFSPKRIALVDFGLVMSAACGEDIDWDHGYLTAPERLNGKVAPPSTAGDVFQFGMLAGMLIADQPPIPDLRETLVVVNNNEERVSWTPKVQKQLEEFQVPDNISSILAQTLHTDPAKRPSAAQLVSALVGVSLSIATPAWDDSGEYDHPDLPDMMEALLTQSLRADQHPASWLMASRILKLWSIEKQSGSLIVWVSMFMSDFWGSVSKPILPPTNCDDNMKRAGMLIAARLVEDPRFSSCFVPPHSEPPQLLAMMRREWKQGRCVRTLDSVVGDVYADVDIHPAWQELLVALQ